ncbi:MAG: hypothetical protein DRJ35_06465 [Thermoprotei archaeon]|nr:MAG: hypothetical protein DRJ35_06465 [Thermoprotei archaeon]
MSLLRDPELASTATEQLGKIGSEQAIEPLFRLAQQSKSDRRKAVAALQAISRKQGIRIFLDGSYTKVG